LRSASINAGTASDIFVRAGIKPRTRDSAEG
jgi:hypothetical protein